MAQPTVAKPGAFVISLGDGATPEVFTAPCGLTTKAARWNRGLGEVNIPDCDDPDAVIWIARDVETQLQRDRRGNSRGRGNPGLAGHHQHHGEC